MINNPEETLKSPKSEIGLERSYELYFDHYDKIERFKDYERVRDNNEVREVMIKPKINKNSRKIVNKDENYIPIYKRINKTIK